MSYKSKAILFMGILVVGSRVVFAADKPATKPTRVSQLPAMRLLTEQEMVAYATACEPGAPQDGQDGAVALKAAAKVLQDFEAMIDRFACRGLDVSKERAEVARLTRQQAGVCSGR